MGIGPACRFAAIAATFGAIIGAAPWPAQGQAPCVLTCSANVTTPNDPNQCGAVVNYSAPMTSGTCGIVVCTPASGAFYPVGTTTVTCTEDMQNATCSFTITVNDTEPPSITCPANVTASNDPGQCSAVINYTAPTVSDNCPGTMPPVCTPASGGTFPMGTTPASCMVTDAAGNTATCGFTITVNDTEPPTITCPPDQSRPGPNGTAAVDYPPPSASDNCPGVTSECVPPSGSTLPVGDTTATCTATDTSGNTAACTFLISVFGTVPTLTAAGLAALVLVVWTVGAWMLYRRRATG